MWTGLLIGATTYVSNVSGITWMNHCSPILDYLIFKFEEIF